MREYQARQAPVQQIHQDLLAKWRCLKLGCNEGRHCYIDGKEEHFPISTGHSNFWAREIEREGSSITPDRPSNALLGMLKSQKRSQQKQVKKDRSEQQQSTPTAMTTPSFSAPGPTINYYIGRGPEGRDELPDQRSTSRYVSATPRLHQPLLHLR